MANQNFIRQIENSDEFKLLDAVVKDETTVQDAVQKMVDKTMEALALHGPTKHNGVGLPDYNISLAVLELAQRLDPSDHTKLVEFTTHLQQQQAIDSSTKEPLKVQGRILWTDMPSFGYTELETWYEFGGAHKNPCDSALGPEQRDRWVKLNAFLAQLTQAAPVGYPSPGEEARFLPLDESLRAVWAISMALENESSPATLNNTAAMEAACQWFVFAADRLWANVVNNRQYPKQAGAGPGKRYSEKEWTGYSRERWAIWENALKEAQEACQDPRMAKLIRHALEKLIKSTRAINGD
ncbi:hypothetical protein N7539_008015 [Penicillium diatomitis]|uniref:Uncharacterized protein n=1 Tax=Penicillium diatomitis TaxID=2819901 RepID=A0A9W9WUJ2_9EURO|nr:uncharacterized protein N7539_008015 [Penicillium diatomitis]KAJ5475728.1 hypothetical protein N7539_008015 [Penicillium diatomitis]